MSYTEDLRFAYRSSKSIALDKYPPEVESLHMTNVFTHSFRENPPFEATMIALMNVLNSHHKRSKDIVLTDRKRWQTLPWNGQRINSLHLFGLSVNFSDLNPMPIPEYIIPPINLIKKYYEKVLASNHPLLLSEQFDEALSLVDDHPTAACIMLMIATRACARGQDKKILGVDIPSQSYIDMFRYKIAGYGKQWVEEEPPDPLGNTYYFFTNAGMNMLLRANGVTRIHEDALSIATFPFGARTMQFFREHAAKQPQLVSHKLPAKFGLVAGSQLAQTFLSEPN